MDDRIPDAMDPADQAPAPVRPLPVVMTLELAAPGPGAAPLSFTIPLREPPRPPSWLELLGQR